MPAVDVGDRLTREFTVEPEHLASSWGNDLPVLATPIVLWWSELVAKDLMAPAISDGQMCVGAGHDRVRHLAPTGLGEQVRVSAEVVEASGRQVAFDVEAVDGTGTIYKAAHTRAVVGRDKFIEALDGRAS